SLCCEQAASNGTVIRKTTKILRMIAPTTRGYFGSSGGVSSTRISSTGRVAGDIAAGAAGTSGTTADGTVVGAAVSSRIARCTNERIRLLSTSVTCLPVN